MSESVDRAVAASAVLILACIVATSGAVAQNVEPSTECEEHELATALVTGGAMPTPASRGNIVPQSARARPVKPRKQADPESVEASTPAIDFEIVYTAEVRSNISGGLRQAVRYLDNLDMLLTVDADRVFGWQGATFFAYGLYNNGVRLSGDIVGDTQGVSNIETTVRAVRLYEAWIEQRFAKDRASVKLGLYDINTEFDVVDTAALFLLSSHGIGPDFSQSGQNGPSIFPVTSLAVRVDYKLSDEWLLRAVLLDGVPGDPARARRTTVRFNRGDGVLAIGEVAYVAETTRAAVGYWRYSAQFEDDLDSLIGGEPVERRGNDGGYVLLEGRLTHEPYDIDQGLAGWVRFGMADKRFNPIAWYASSGLVYTGVVAGRDDDQLGLAIAWAEFGDRYRQARQIDGTGSRYREVNIELSYRAPVAPWLTLQPDVQYVINPGGVRELRNALVIGLRAELGL